MDNSQNPYFQQFQEPVVGSQAPTTQPGPIGNQPATPQPGALEYRPTTPETPPEPENKNESIYNEKVVEKTPVQEVLPPTIPISTAQVVENPPASNNSQQAAEETSKHIVDKTKTLTPLHHIKNTQDKLTTLADTEEEEFISEVETAHGHK